MARRKRAPYPKIEVTNPGLENVRVSFSKDRRVVQVTADADLSDRSERVDHPRHYNAGIIEHCEMVEDQGHADGYYFGQITKYAFRAGRKDGSPALEDLQKLAWYAARWVVWTERGPEIWKIQLKPTK